MKHKYNPTVSRESGYLKRYLIDIDHPDGKQETVLLDSYIQTEMDVRKWWAREWKSMGHTGLPERIKWVKE
jgi:hypothetical protein